MGGGAGVGKWEVVQVWCNEGSKDGDTIELVYCWLQDRVLWYGASPQTAYVLHLKFPTKNSNEGAKTSPSAARSIPSHRSVSAVLYRTLALLH